MKIFTLHEYPFTADYWQANLTSDGTTNALTFSFVASVKCAVASGGAPGKITLTAPNVFKQGGQFREIRDRNGDFVYPITTGTAAPYKVIYVEPLLDVFGEVDGYKHTLSLA